MKILVAIDHSEASEAVIKEIAARPWPPKSCVEVLNVLEHAHLWTVSQTAEEAWQDSTALIDRAVQELRGRGVEATPRIASRRRKKRDPGPSQRNASGSGFRRLEWGVRAGKILPGKSRCVRYEPRAMFGGDRSDQGRQVSGCSQNTSSDRWLRVRGARRAIDCGKALAGMDRGRSV